MEATAAEARIPAGARHARPSAIAHAVEGRSPSAEPAAPGAEVASMRACPARSGHLRTRAPASAPGHPGGPGARSPSSWHRPRRRAEVLRPTVRDLLPPLLGPSTEGFPGRRVLGAGPPLTEPLLSRGIPIRNTLPVSGVMLPLRRPADAVVDVHVVHVDVRMVVPVVVVDVDHHGTVVAPAATAPERGPHREPYPEGDRRGGRDIARRID